MIKITVNSNIDGQVSAAIYEADMTRDEIEAALESLAEGMGCVLDVSDGLLCLAPNGGLLSVHVSIPEVDYA